MEPGRELYAFVDSCNEAQCTGLQLMGSVVIVSTQAQQAVSQDGGSLELSLAAKRRKRSTSKVIVQTPNGKLELKEAWKMLLFLFSCS